MKLTKSKLKQIIKEELGKVNEAWWSRKKKPQEEEEDDDWVSTGLPHERPGGVPQADMGAGYDIDELTPYEKADIARSKKIAKEGIMDKIRNIGGGDKYLSGIEDDDDLMGHGADVKMDMDPSETIKDLYGHIARVHDETGEKFLVRILDMMEENYPLADETP